MLASRLCLREAARPCISAIPITLLASRGRPRSPLLWNSKRVFATTPRHRKVDARIQGDQQLAADQKQPAEENVQTESLKKEKAAQPQTKNDPLLAEQTVSNKEQRAADWGIIKNMAQYIWPKDDFGTRFRVGLSVGLLVGAKVRHCSLYLAYRSYVLIGYVGPQCPSALLLQIHRRQHEHRLRCHLKHCSHSSRRVNLRLRSHTYRRNSLPRIPKCSLRSSSPECDPKSCRQRLRPLA